MICEHSRHHHRRPSLTDFGALGLPTTLSKGTRAVFNVQLCTEPYNLAMNWARNSLRAFLYNLSRAVCMCVCAEIDWIRALGLGNWTVAYAQAINAFL